MSSSSPSNQQQQQQNDQEKGSKPTKDFVDESSLKLFPERRGDFKFRERWKQIFMFTPDRYRTRCERYVMNAVENSHLVKLMMAALKSSGCEIDVRRHISCDYCARGVTGGYDPTLNQIVVCYNRCNKSMIQGILSHEMLHMFDYCRANFDFDNIRHVACSEIRAANLMHCSIISGMLSGTVSPFNLAKAHAQCVKQKAVASILAVRPEMASEEGWKIVDSVFDVCYNDLEPVGRRIRARSDDPRRAYRERYLMGYD